MMCTLGFKEALEKRITLPEEQPSHLEAIIEYLYTDDFGGLGNPQFEMGDTDKAVELAHLYVSADKYGLEAMKDVIVGKLRLCTKPDDLSNCLEVAEIIYESVPFHRDPYPVYFRFLIVELLTSADNTKTLYVNAECEERIDAGGPLAVDIHRAYRTFWDNKTSVEQAPSAAETLHGRQLIPSRLDDIFWL